MENLAKAMEPYGWLLHPTSNPAYSEALFTCFCFGVAVFVRGLFFGGKRSSFTYLGYLYTLVGTVGGGSVATFVSGRGELFILNNNELNGLATTLVAWLAINFSPGDYVYRILSVLPIRMCLGCLVGCFQSSASVTFMNDLLSRHPTHTLGAAFIGTVSAVGGGQSLLLMKHLTGYDVQSDLSKPGRLFNTIALGSLMYAVAFTMRVPILSALLDQLHPHDRSVFLQRILSIVYALTQFLLIFRSASPASSVPSSAAAGNKEKSE